MCVIDGCREPAEFSGLCHQHRRSLIAKHSALGPDISLDDLDALADRARQALNAVIAELAKLDRPQAGKAAV